MAKEIKKKAKTVNKTEVINLDEEKDNQEELETEGTDEELEVNSPEDSEEENEDTTEEEVESDEVIIKMKKSVSSFIGNAWYRLEAGKEYSVPSNVKSILISAGYLDAI